VRAAKVALLSDFGCKTQSSPSIRTAKASNIGKALAKKLKDSRYILTIACAPDRFRAGCCAAAGLSRRVAWKADRRVT
jgi:hypothetical protein